MPDRADRRPSIADLGLDPAVALRQLLWTRTSRRRTIAVLATLVAAGGATTAWALNSQEDYPSLKVRDAALGQWFLPRASDTDEPYGLHAALRKRFTPTTQVLDDGRTRNELILGGPGDLALDLRYRHAFRHHLIGPDAVRAAIHLHGLPTGTEVNFADSRGRVKNIVKVRGGGYVGGVLPDDDVEVQTIIRRPAGSIAAVRFGIGNISAVDAQREYDSHLQDLADSFGLAKSVALKIAPEPGVPLPENTNTPRYNITDVSVDPRLHGRWFLPNNSKGEPWNDAIYLNLPSVAAGTRQISEDPIGFMGFESAAGSSGTFRLALQVDPNKIDRYTFDNGAKIPGAEPRVLFNTSPEQAGSLVALMNKDWSDILKDPAGNYLTSILDNTGSSGLLLPKRAAELHLLLQLTKPEKPAYVQLKFGPKYPDSTQKFLDGNAGSLTGADFSPANKRTRLVHIPGATVYQPTR